MTIIARLPHYKWLFLHDLKRSCFRYGVVSADPSALAAAADSAAPLLQRRATSIRRKTSSWKAAIQATAADLIHEGELAV